MDLDSVNGKNAKFSQQKVSTTRISPLRKLKLVAGTSASVLADISTGWEKQVG